MKAASKPLRNYPGIMLRGFLALLLVCPATPLRSDELTAVTSTRDATISQAAPATNNGVAATVSTHTAQNANQRSLVRFDLSATGLNSNTALKTSTLNLVPTTPLFTSRSQEVHRVTGTTDWTEAGVNWNTRNGVLAWTNPGGDFDAAATDTRPSGTTAGTAISFNVLSDATSANIPQGWINGTIPNYGLLVKDQLEDGATWSFTRAITVTVGATAPFNGYNGYSAQVTGFNTAALVTAGKMRSDCNDLSIARFAANIWTQLDRQVINCNTASTTIWFKLQADIAANGTDASYSLFYGNANAPAPPANLNSVYLAYDNFDADTLNQPPAGWAVQGGGPWNVVADVGTNRILRESNATAAIRNVIKVNSVTTERDVWVQADVRMTTAAGLESTGCLLGRVGGTTAANMTAYRSCLQYVIVGANPNQRVSQLASWNAGAFNSLQQPLYPWVNATFYTVGGAFFGSPATLRTFVNGVLQAPSIVGNNNVATAGSVGLFVYDGDPVNYDFDNFLARRYTEPEPTTALAAESANALSPLYGSRENIVANQPTLNLHYLRDVTMSAPTLGISEITLNWTFPIGSTNANYDGVLFAKQAGSVAPSFAPADGTVYNTGAQPVAGQFIAANTGAFATVSAFDENGDTSIVLPGTQYAYKAYTHDATVIAGAASSAAPHYSFGNTSTQTNTTVTGGGANKNWSYKTGATTLAAPALDPGNIVLTGGNDNAVHAMSVTNGQRNYQPGGTSGLTGGAIQGRPPLIAAGDTSNPTCKNVCAVVYVAAGDGTVYAFRADTGALLWQTAVLTTGAGSGFLAAPAVEVKSFSGVGYLNAFDLVIVATRNVGAGSTTNNRVFGLNGNTGATVWTFNPGNMDIVNATPYIDYVNNIAWVASRSIGGIGQPSLWQINTNTGSLSASFNLNDIDQAPTQNFDGRVIYVTTNGGVLYAVRTDINNCAQSSAALGVSPRGFPIPIETVALNDDVFFSTSTGVSKIHVIYPLAACAPVTFTVSPGGWVNPAITNPSSLMFTSPPQAEFMYVASSDGHLYKIDPTTGANAANRLINAGATIGDPSFDTVIQKFYMGDSTGHIFSFDLF
ncbi:MAG TPA: DNRLRE domain-containing protein [Candidatus Limnocylindria bacterium]|nr:DNRLRE domain-containing protein [Candidatus Limnocylindria bacterium]